MELTSLIKNTLKKGNIFLAITFFLFPINDNIATYPLVISIIYGVYYLITESEISNKIKTYFILPSIFFIYLLINSYFSVSHFDIEVISKYAIIFLIPFAYIKHDSNDLKNYVKWFIFGILLSIIIAFYRFFEDGSYSIQYSLLINYIKVHPVYYSGYLLIIISYILYNTLSSNKKTIIIVTLLFFIFLLQSRIAYISTFLIISIYYISKKNILKWILPIIIVFSSLLFIISFTSKTPLDIAISERYQIWESAISIIKEKPILGYGVGTEYDEIGKQFFYDAKFKLLDDHKNSHNMYLSLLIQFGAVGFLLMLSIFCFPLFIIPKRHIAEYISFLIIVGVISLTESIFFRNWSVIFVLMLNNYLYGFKKTA